MNAATKCLCSCVFFIINLAWIVEIQVSMLTQKRFSLGFMDFLSCNLTPGREPEIRSQQIKNRGYRLKWIFLKGLKWKFDLERKGQVGMTGWGMMTAQRPSGPTKRGRVWYCLFPCKQSNFFMLLFILDLWPWIGLPALFTWGVSPDNLQVSHYYIC